MEGFEIKAGKDGLWLSTPKIDGVEETINLLTEDSKQLKRMLVELWQKMYNNQINLAA